MLQTVVPCMPFIAIALGKRSTRSILAVFSTPPVRTALMVLLFASMNTKRGTLAISAVSLSTVVQARTKIYRLVRRLKPLTRQNLRQRLAECSSITRSAPVETVNFGRPKHRARFKSILKPPCMFEKIAHLARHGRAAPERPPQPLVAERDPQVPAIRTGTYSGGIGGTFNIWRTRYLFPRSVKKIV
jgi:hypothetical protein